MTKQTIAIGDNGTQLVSKLGNNFNDTYLGVESEQYTIIPTDVISNQSWWTTKLETYSIFIVTSDYDFNEATLTIPAGVTIIFRGGVWSDGVLVGTNTIIIIEGAKQAFTTSLTFAGTWKLDHVSPQHFGAITNSRTDTFSNDCSAAIQACVNSPFDVFIPNGFYYITTAITIPYARKVIKCAEKIPDMQYDAVLTNPDHTRFYSNQDIDYFVIQAPSVQLLKSP